MSNYVRRDDFFGDITPQNTRSDSVILPQGTYIPAKWLPVAWVDTNRDAGSDAFVISKGKPVTFDATGALIPAGWYGLVSRIGFASTIATTTIVLTYLQRDVDWFVQDLVTGLPVAAPVSYSYITVAKALIDRGLVPFDGYSTAISTTTDCAAVFAKFIKLPVGLAPYDFYKYGGKAEDGDQVFTNYLKQSNVQFITERQLEIPHRIGQGLASDDFDSTAITVVGTAPAAGVVMADGSVWDATALAGITRYALMGVTASKPVVALKLDLEDVAHATDRTTFVCDDDTFLVKVKSSPSLIRTAGDYFIDFEQGVVFVHSDVWDDLVTATGTVTFTYAYYLGAAMVMASSQRYVYFEGLGVPGDRIGIDRQGNYVVSGSATDVLPSGLNVGFLSFMEYEPYALMEKVKSSGEGRTQVLPASAKMPGTATKGFSDAIIKAESTVADRKAIVTLRFL